MSALSENVSKKKRRGRPRAFPEEYEATWSAIGIGIDCTTRRGKMNTWYVVMARRALNDEPGLEWLFDRSGTNGGTGTFRMTILSQLGRVEDPATMRRLPHEICEWKPQAAEAVRYIREVCTGRAVEPSVEGLTDALLRALNQYRKAHWGTTHRMVRAALRKMQEAVAQTEKQEQEQAEQAQVAVAKAAAKKGA